MVIWPRNTGRKFVRRMSLASWDAVSFSLKPHRLLYKSWCILFSTRSRTLPHYHPSLQPTEMAECSLTFQVMELNVWSVVLSCRWKQILIVRTRQGNTLMQHLNDVTRILSPLTVIQTWDNWRMVSYWITKIHNWNDTKMDPIKSTGEY